MCNSLGLNGSGIGGALHFLRDIHRQFTKMLVGSLSVIGSRLQFCWHFKPGRFVHALVKYAEGGSTSIDEYLLPDPYLGCWT